MRTAVFVLLAACSKSPPPAAKVDPATTTAPTTATTTTTTAPETKPVKPFKDPAKAKQMIAAGATVIDVRTTAEYGEAHLPNATNLPIEEFKVADVDKLVAGDKAKPIVLHCAAGKRAAKALDQLEAAGYTNVVNGGGLDDLQ